MGVTTVKIIVKNPFSPSNSSEGEFSLADGRTIKKKLGSALINFEGRELAVPVVLGEKGDSALLGVTTLESFGVGHSKLILG